MLDEQCRLARSTDRSFATATAEMCKDHPRFECNNIQKGAGKFSIQHYAGAVEYTTTNFIEKNKDELPQEGTDLLLGSSNSFVSYLGGILCSSPSNVNGSGASVNSTSSSLRRSASTLSRASVGAQFSAQLRELRERIERTAPHYVRCLKPNDLLVPNNFEQHIIADQLRCAGVLEAIRVSRVGFPQRYQHDLFVSRYCILGLKQLQQAAKLRRTHPCEVLVNAVAQQLKQAGGSTCDSTKESQRPMSSGAG